MRRIFTAFVLLASLVGGVRQGWCQDEDQGLRTFGIRGGLSATQRDEYFHQYEGFITYGLPWSVRGESGWGLALQLNASAGALHGAKETGGIFAVGPGVVFDKAGGKGVALELGGDLNGLTRYKFGRVNLNGHVLFDGHIGISCRFAGGPGIGYRFQHMSNGGLNGNLNTGVDLHMLELSWNLQ